MGETRKKERAVIRVVWIMWDEGPNPRSSRVSASQWSNGAILWSLRKFCDFLAKWRYREPTSLFRKSVNVHESVP